MNFGRCTALILLLIVTAGCAVTRVVTITTKPPEAQLKIDGIDRGTAPVTDEMVFNSPTDTHSIVASKLGYKDSTLVVQRDDDRKELTVELRPQTKIIHISVQPVPGLISIDGRPTSVEPTQSLTRELEFTVDAKGAWTTHTVTVDRQNFQSTTSTIKYTDADSTYVVNLVPMNKSISVSTTPPGATVYLDYQKLGMAPVKGASEDFAVDPDTNEFKPRALRAEKPGYDPVTLQISWDSGKTDYHIDLTAKTKTAHFSIDPPTAVVKVDGAESSHSPDGGVTTTLQFPPTDDAGTLKTYSVSVTKKTADSEYEPQTFTLGWENGRTDYTVHLKEILTRPVQLLTAELSRSDDGWEVQPKWSTTLAMKDVMEGAGKSSPQQMTRLARGTQLGSMALSPDGSKLVLTVLTAGQTKNDFHSQMLVLRTDGNGGEDIISDGKSLDLMPTFTPGGESIVFSSNRAGRRLNVWSMSASGAAGITRLTTGDTFDVWPTIDSDPKARLFYEALVDTRPDPRLYMTQLGTIFMTDLTTLSGTQPRISPKNDTLLFCAMNEKTGKRDIYKMSDRGGDPENLTNTPDADECDASWSKDGSRIVFASDRTDDPSVPRQYDLWMLDFAHPGDPIRLTNNASLDDSPLFDISGSHVYFRSNRGGQWQVWRMDLSK